MRHNQNRRSRGRNRKGPNPLTRSYESNGPDVKVRGTPAHIAEKYASLARDALSSGDPVAAENYLQHAEHYNRIVMAAQAQQAAQAQNDSVRDNDNRDADDGEQPRSERSGEGRNTFRGNGRRQDRNSSGEDKVASESRNSQPSAQEGEAVSDQPGLHIGNGADQPQNGSVPSEPAATTGSDGNGAGSSAESQQLDAANGVSAAGEQDTKPNGRRRRASRSPKKNTETVANQDSAESEANDEKKATTQDGQAALSAFPD